LKSKIELRALHSVVSSIENPTEHTKKLKMKSNIFTIIAFLCLIVAFLLYFQNLKGLYNIALASFGGILYGMSMYLDSSIKQWQYIAKFVDIGRIKEELKAFET
jgi:hypothetical protein